MQVKSVTISQFKNLKEVGISFSSRFNCFVGNNGAGKTNVLDALYLLSMTKSFFTSVDGMNVRHGDDFFSVRGSYLRCGEELELLCSYSAASKKSFKKNGKQYERLSDHIGYVPLVMISPEDNELIDGGSEVRRRWLDMAVSQSNTDYLVTLMKYNKVLLHRNTLLKGLNGVLPRDCSLIDVLDERLVEFGNAVTAWREEFLVQFGPIFNSYYSKISSDREQVELRYKSSFASSNFETSLKDNLRRDCALGYTSVGVHRDDLTMLLSDYPVKNVGSQGQKKSFIIALKFALYDWLKSKKGVKPLLLLDDIFDKLDPTRVQSILNIVGSDEFGQIFITDTRRESVERMLLSIGADYKMFEVNDGVVSWE